MIKNIFLVLLLFPAASFATTTGEIESIIAEGADDASGFVIKFKSNLEVPGTSGCSSRYHYLNASTEKGKFMFSMLLSARVSGTPIKVIFKDTGCTSGNKGSIANVWL